MQKKNTKHVLTPEPLYHNDQSIIHINGGGFYCIVDYYFLYFQSPST